MIITGGKSGAEAAVIRVCRDLGLPVTGSMAPGARVQGGYRPDLEGILTSRKTGTLHDATKEMAGAADLIIFLGEEVRAARKLRELANKRGTAFEVVNPDPEGYAITYHLASNLPERTYITGDREDRRPGMEAKAYEAVRKGLERWLQLK
jgi:hypothetical protein